MPRTVLLADDSVTIQKVVGITFANEDVDLVTVDNGDDAVAKAREIAPDLVLADVVMPGLSGYEVCEAIRSDARLRQTPVLLLCGTFEEFDEDRARAAGANGHITKPFEAQTLVSQVKALIDRPRKAEPIPTSPPPTARPLDTPATAQPSPMTGPPSPQPRPDQAPPPHSTAGAPGNDGLDLFDRDFGNLAEPMSPGMPAASEERYFEFQDGKTEFDIGGEFEAAASADPAPGAQRAQGMDPGFSSPGTPVLDVDPGGESFPDLVVDAARAMANETSSQNIPAADAAFRPEAPSSRPAAGFPEPGEAQGSPAQPPMDPATRGSFDSSLEDLHPLHGEPVVDPQAGRGFDVSAQDLAPPHELTQPAAPAPPPDSFDDDPFAQALEPGFGPPAQAAPEPSHEAFGVELDPMTQPHEPVATPTPPTTAPVESWTPPTQPIAAPHQPTPVPDPQPRDATSPSPANHDSIPPDLAAAVRERLHGSLEKVAWEALGDVSERLVREAVDRIEQIAWEVVPQMAEALIKEEIRRLRSDGD